MSGRTSKVKTLIMTALLISSVALADTFGNYPAGSPIANTDYFVASRNGTGTYKFPATDFRTYLIEDAINDSTTTKAPSSNAVFDGLALKIPTSYLDTDTALTANSDAKIATQKATKAYADAKVADAINNGTTTIAPSQNAVFDELALKAPLASPSFTTPNIGAATGTSLALTNDTNQILLDSDGTYVGTLNVNTLSNNRTWNLPNASGTLLVTSSIGSTIQAYDATLDAFAAYNTNGLLTQTSANTFTGRTLTGTSNEVAVTNGDGVSGNPTVALASTLNLSSKTLRVPNGTSLPGTCTVGDAFMDTDATTGQRWYLCQATDTWALQGDGGGGGGFDATAVDAVTWSDGANASNAWTFDVSGTDTVMTWGNGTASFSGSMSFVGNPGVTIGNGATSAGAISFLEDSDNGSNTAKLIGPSSTADVTLTLQATTGTIYSTGGTDVAIADGGTGASTVAGARTNLGLRQEYCVAMSDQTTNLTTGTGKAYLYLPAAATVNSVRAYVNTAPTGSTIIVDINEAGTTLMSSTKLSIDASEKTSGTAASAAALTDTSIAANAEITFDIDQIGSTIAGKGLVACVDVTF